MGAASSIASSHASSTARETLAVVPLLKVETHAAIDEEKEALKRQVKDLRAENKILRAQLKAALSKLGEGPTQSFGISSSADSHEIGTEASMVAAGNMWWHTRNMVMRHFKTAGGADVGWKGLPMQTRHIINELPEDEMSQRASRGEWPMVITLSQLNQWDEAHGDSICAIYRLARLEAGDDVPQLASMALETLNSDDSSAADDIFTFPSNPSSLLWTSVKQNEILNVTTLEGARKFLSGVWNKFSFKKEFRSLVRSCAEGRIHEGITIRNCVYNETNMSSYLNATLWPCVLLEEDGGFSWCFMRHGQMMPVSSPSVWAWSLRDMLMVKNTPVPLVLVDPKSGTLVWQNSASMELIGCHGVDNVQAGPGKRSSKESHLNYLSILFHNEDELLEEMKMTVGAGNPWSGRMKVQSPELIRLIGARRGANIWYDISVSQARDPVDLVPLITILSIDVTSAVKAERRIKLLQESQQSLLQQILPQQVTQMLLKSQNKFEGKTESNLIFDRSVKGSEPIRNTSEFETVDRKPSQTPVSRSLLSSASSITGALTRQHVMDLSTKHDEVSILFADIVGFTTLSSSIDPSAVMLMLSDLFGRFDSILDEFDVWKVGTIGDCYFCITGLFDRSGKENGRAGSEDKFVRSPDEDIGQGKLGGHDPDHAEKMLGFAKSMMELLKDVPSPMGGNIQMRLGIHSGSIWSGVVGRKMPRFDVFGDAVNVASRMESSGIPGKIHVSESFAKLLPKELWSERSVQVKGKGEMRTYLLEEGDAGGSSGPHLKLTKSQSSKMESIKKAALKEGNFVSWWTKAAGVALLASVKKKGEKEKHSQDLAFPG